MFPPAESEIVLSQDVKPLLLTEIEWSPAGKEKVDGVLPTNFPFISTSAEPGVELMVKLAFELVA